METGKEFTSSLTRQQECGRSRNAGGNPEMPEVGLLTAVRLAVVWEVLLDHGTALKDTQVRRGCRAGF